MTPRVRALIAFLAALSLAPAFHIGMEIKMITPGLYRGRVPFREADFAELKRLGIRTILDIRGNTPITSKWERRKAEAHGFKYINTPMGFRPLRDGSADPALEALANEADYPLFLHCQLDRDRTSALIAAYRVQYQGWDIDSAADEAYEFGIRRYFVGLNRYTRAGGMK